LEDRLRPEHVVAELLRRELHRQDVAVAVAGGLMTARGDLVDQLGLAFGDPAQDEERRADLVLGEQAEHAARSVGHAARERLPARGWKERAEILHLEPVFDVEGQECRNHTRRYPMSRNRAASARPGKEWYCSRDRSMATGSTVPV